MFDIFTRFATRLSRGNGHAKEELTRKPQTRGYVSAATMYQQRPRDLPPLGFDMVRAMLLDPAIRLGLAMRAAPISGVNIAYKVEGADGKPTWKPGVLAKRPEVSEFVRRQLARIWTHGLDDILTAQIWGWSAGEVLYRSTSRGTVEVDCLLARHAADTRALIKDGEVIGTRVLRVPHAPSGSVDLHFPKSWFHAHKPEPGEHYGTTALIGAYSPWADKCFQGGATDVRRLFMHKDAYGGADMSYPDETTWVNGVETPNRDLAMQIVEQIQAGGVTVRPAVYDDKGNERWTLKRATVPSSPTHILDYPKDLDTEIYHGLEIPDDVIESGSTGAWAGKRIPMAAFYAGLDGWVASIINDIVTQIIEHLVLLNFGTAEEFEVTHQPLADQAMEQQQKAEQQEQPQGQPGQQPQQQAGGDPLSQYRMSLDAEAAVGQGVLSAAELVKATRRVMLTRMAREEPHQFSSTQFNLPGELAFEVRKIADRIPHDDLAEDGREDNPHITVKFGLHTDDPEDVRQIVQDMPPVAVQFGEASCFYSDEHDVIKIDIESGGLRELNARLAESLPHTDTHPDYQPHMTVAYVKPGLGDHIAGTLNDLKGRVAVFDRLVFSDKVRQCHSIPLTGKAKRFSSETRPGETKTVDGVTYVLNDNHRWERAKEAIGAVSPNVGEDATLAEAFQQLRSDRHVRMRVAFERVDADLGLSAEQIDVVGDWGDGAEGSIISRYDGVRDFAELQYAMAWKGLLGNQKAVLSFLENDGPDAIYGTQVTGKIKSVRDAMDAVGIPDRSIYVGMGGRINLLVIDRGRKLNEAIKEFGEHFNATIKQQIGTSEFLGVDPTGTREAAREVYREYIAKYEGTFSDRPRASARRQALALAVGPEHATADDRGRSRVIGISRRKSESSDA